MNFFGLGLGLATLLIIGLGFVWVIRGEYYFGYLWWPYVLGAGAVLIGLSLLVPWVWGSALLGAVGASLIWGATELKEQAVRGEIGWYPFNPKPKPQPPLAKIIQRWPAPAPMIGVLVMAYGGPDNLDEVEPYLLDVRGFRPTAPAIINEVRERYREIGGRSPILESTQAQAQALQAALKAEGRSASGAEFNTLTGMRHWRPYIQDSLASLAQQGVTRVVTLAMAPHYSRLSIGAYDKKVDEAIAAAGAPLEIARIEHWHLLPGYLDALTGHVRSALGRFPAELRADVPIIFTAHSLPQRIVEWQDPYPAELLATVDAVMERLGPHPHRFAFQSAAISPDPWLGPDAGAVIAELAGAGHRQVLLAPVGFVCEHVEILYDVDVVFQRQTRSLGVQLERIEMLNTAPAMITGLAELVRQRAAEAGWL